MSVLQLPSVSTSGAIDYQHIPDTCSTKPFLRSADPLALLPSWNGGLEGRGENGGRAEAEDMVTVVSSSNHFCIRMDKGKHQVCNVRFGLCSPVEKKKKNTYRHRNKAGLVLRVL